MEGSAVLGVHAAALKARSKSVINATALRVVVSDFCQDKSLPEDP